MTAPIEPCTCSCDPHRWWCRDYQEADLPYGASTAVIEFDNGPNVLCHPDQLAGLQQVIAQNTRILREQGRLDGPDGAPC